MSCEDIASTYSHFFVLVFDTSTLVDQVDVVGEQGVAAVLRDDTERDDDSQPPAVAAGPDEVHVAAVCLCVNLHSDRVPHLLVLELHSCVVLVTVGVVVCKHVESLVVALLGNEPSRRLGDPEDETQLDDGWETLEDSDGSPGPLTVGLRGTPGDPGDEESAQVPETVVDGGENSTVLRVADLSEQNGRAHLRETVSETENQTTSEVDVPVGGKGRNDRSNDHDGTADGNWDLTSEPLSDERTIGLG
jgi:hypothetical protein